MLVIRVELHSAVTGQRTELARMHISNTGGGTAEIGTYAGDALRGRDTRALDRGVTQRSGFITGYPRQRLHVWNLVAAMLADMGYGFASKQPGAATRRSDAAEARTTTPNAG